MPERTIRKKSKGGKNMIYGEQDRKYVEFMKESAKDEPGWFDFAGKVFMIGIEMDMSVDKITEYLFEAYHGFDHEEVKGDYDKIKRDMKEYFDNAEIKL